jgi:hypothetical protein
MADSGTRAVPSLRYLRGSPEFSLEHRFIDGDIAPVGGFMWDGRAASVRAQAQLPLLAPNEMANSSPLEVVSRLGKTAYAPQFRAQLGETVFEEPGRAFAAVLEALDAFQKTASEFSPYTSRYDAFLRGEIELTAQEERGVGCSRTPGRGTVRVAISPAAVGAFRRHSRTTTTPTSEFREIRAFPPTPTPITSILDCAARSARISTASGAIADSSGLPRFGM